MLKTRIFWFRWPKQVSSQALGCAAAGDLHAAFGRTPEPAARVGRQGVVKQQQRRPGSWEDVDLDKLGMSHG